MMTPSFAPDCPEPWCSIIPHEVPPGPHADLWTLTFKDQGGRLRLVAVFGRVEAEARGQAPMEARRGEELFRVDRGGTLPMPKTRQEIDAEQREREIREHDRLHPLEPMQSRIFP